LFQTISSKINKEQQSTNRLLKYGCYRGCSSTQCLQCLHAIIMSSYPLVTPLPLLPLSSQTRPMTIKSIVQHHHHEWFFGTAVTVTALGLSMKLLYNETG